MFLHCTLLITALLWTQMSVTSAGNILVYPVEGSLWLNMNIILRELLKRGHDLTVVQIPHYKSGTISVTQVSNFNKREVMASLLGNNIKMRKGKWFFYFFMAVNQELFSVMEQGHRVSVEK